jgi:hypothetical protein
MQREGNGVDHLSVSLSMPGPVENGREDFQPQITKISIENHPINEVITITQLKATSGTFNIIF